MVNDRLGKLITELLHALVPCGDALEMNAPAFYMLAQEVEKLGVPVRQLTLAEVEILAEKARQRYAVMDERLRCSGEA